MYNVDPAAAYRYYALGPPTHAFYGGGPDWHGRGYIQATHKGTYEAFNAAMKAQFGKDTGVDVTPDFMLDAETSAHFAAWFFLQKGIVPLCEAGNWNEVRRRVLGGADADGVNKLRHAEAVLLPIAQARGLLA